MGGNETTSAVPADLLRYESVMQQLDQQLMDRARALVQALDDFNASRPEFAANLVGAPSTSYGGDGGVGQRVLQYASDHSARDRWVGDVGRRFSMLEDGGLEAAIGGLIASI